MTVGHMDKKRKHSAGTKRQNSVGGDISLPQQQKREQTKQQQPRKSNDGKHADDDDPNKHEDDHPFKRGSIIMVKWAGDGTDRFCDVIERAQNEKTGEWSYYVHYHDFNRRMDEWVNIPAILKPPSVAGAEHKAMKEQLEREKVGVLRTWGPVEGARMSRKGVSAILFPSFASRVPSISLPGDGSSYIIPRWLHVLLYCPPLPLLITTFLPLSGLFARRSSPNRQRSWAKRAKKQASGPGARNNAGRRRTKCPWRPI